MEIYYELKYVCNTELQSYKQGTVVYASVEILEAKQSGKYVSLNILKLYEIFKRQDLIMKWNNSLESFYFI